MYIKTVKFTDYNGVERVEEHHFHLNKAELIKFLSTEGDYTLDKVMEKLYTERNGKKIIQIFEDLMKISYGTISVDGRKFEKSEEIWNNFYQTEGYSILFTEIVTDAKAAADFIKGVIPKDLADEVQKIIDQNPMGIPSELSDYISSPTNK